MKHSKNVQELFTLPVNLEPVLYTDGILVYSSTGLVNKFKEVISTLPSTKDIAPSIAKLIDEEKIIPCYMNKGLLKFLSYKIFSRKEEQGIMGFYHLGQKKVFILIENNITAWGYGNDKALTLTLLHECMHLLADTKPEVFWKMFSSELKSYYQEVLKNYFQLKSVPEANSLVKLLTSFESEGRSKITSRFKQYKSIINNICKDTTLKEDEYQERFDAYFKVLDMGMNDTTTLINKIYNRDKTILKVIIALYKAYGLAFKVNNNITTPFQEMFAPSEVLCVLSELKPSYSKIRKIFKVLA